MGHTEGNVAGSSDCLRFTYGGDPANSDPDAVRFLVGDTLKARPLLDDREVSYALHKNPNHHVAAAVCAEHLSARFTRESDITVGSVSKAMSKIAEAYDKLAGRLRKDAARNVRPSFPAGFVDQKITLEQDPQLDNPEFAIGLTDNPFAVQLNDELTRVDWHGFW